jgi:hypothetical protein
VSNQEKGPLKKDTKQKKKERKKEKRGPKRPQRRVTFEPGLEGETNFHRV